jgi:hypothetical protein
MLCCVCAWDDKEETHTAATQAHNMHSLTKERRITLEFIAFVFCMGDLLPLTLANSRFPCI